MLILTYYLDVTQVQILSCQSSDGFSSCTVTFTALKKIFLVSLKPGSDYMTTILSWPTNILQSNLNMNVGDYEQALQCDVIREQRRGI